MRAERTQRKQTIEMSHEHLTGTVRDALKSSITRLITVFIDESFLDEQ